MSWQSYVDEHLMYEVVESHTLASAAITKQRWRSLGLELASLAFYAFPLSQRFPSLRSFYLDHPISLSVLSSRVPIFNSISSSLVLEYDPSISTLYQSSRVPIHNSISASLMLQCDPSIPTWYQSCRVPIHNSISSYLVFECDPSISRWYQSSRIPILNSISSSLVFECDPSISTWYQSYRVPIINSISSSLVFKCDHSISTLPRERKLTNPHIQIMSWQSYLDEHLMCEAVEGHTLDSAAITGNGGAVWAQSSAFPQVLRFSTNS
ncbi:hypothetical protein K1719_036822 [Acacia pycnantha]|nr:hypothetical protein K1719_036822 [Acacia pycnantha]